MKKCAYCNSTILFRGRSSDGRAYCSDECVNKGFLASVADQIPQSAVDRYVAKVHSNICPKCSGRGPVDVFRSHSVYSLLLFTSWKTQPHICCRSCAVKKQISALLFSLITGWWGFPWGIIITPVQIIRNLIELFRSPDPSHPSEELQRILRYTLAEQVVKKSQMKKDESQAAMS